MLAVRSAYASRCEGSGVTAFAVAPLPRRLVGATGVEPATSSMSRMRSNQLSYAPIPDLGRGGIKVLADRVARKNLLCFHLGRSCQI